MNQNRLADVKRNLDALYEKLGYFEREIINTSHFPAKLERKMRVNPLMSLSGN